MTSCFLKKERMWHCKGGTLSRGAFVFETSRTSTNLPMNPLKNQQQNAPENGPKRTALVRIPPPLPSIHFFWTILGFCCSVSGRVFSILKKYLDRFLFMCPPVCHSLGEFGSASLRDNGCCSWNMFQATSEPIQKKRRQSLSLVTLLKSTNVDELYSFGYQLCICIKNIERINKTHSTSAPRKMYIVIQLSFLSLHQSPKSYK